MKKAVLLPIFLLILPVAFADIAVTTDQSAYNLGNKIKVSASVLQADSFEGFFKLTLSCGNYKLQNYFSNTLSLEANFRTVPPGLDFAELPVTSSMLGDCTIIADLATNEGLIVEEKNSNSFKITRQLTMLPVNGKITASPGDLILVSGVINEAFGNNILKATAKITLDNDSHTVEAVGGKFNLTIELAKNIKSGKHTIGISSFDSKNNFGEALAELDVTAIPTYIKLDMGSSQLLPGAKAGIISSLYDQADELINVSLDLELNSPSGSKVFRKTVQSNENMEYEFSQYAEPGLYMLTSAYKNLLAKTEINISTIKEVKIKYENETVFIENIGNVAFEDELTFILESELKKYPITKNIKVEPSKILSIDLSKEVPLGIYNVKIPFKEGIEPLKEKVEGVIENIAESAKDASLLPEQTEENENLLAANVEIHDNRPVYKKIASGLSSISGALVGADGVLAKNPLIAPIALTVIVLLLVFRYGRKPIMNLIRGKKDDKKNDDE
ncbi:hypothetical protein HYX07_04905 [Candidatus Woesearchaeota archaeon]|nr:hypothetical protein [Candidatus Woesearchaeota archaeon]